MPLPPLLAAAALRAAAPPHIAFLLMDDVGWNDVSVHGATDIPTPNIDSLAAGGVLLDNYYVNPVCSPTRASLMSGRSIIHHGIYTPFGQASDSEGLNLTYTLMPQHLKESYGYATYMVGKWHLGMKDAAYLPSHRGFDRYYGYYSGVMDYWTHGMSGPSPKSGPLDLHQGGGGFRNGSWPAGMLDEPVYGTTGMYSTPLFANVSAAWIEAHAQNLPGTPLFLYLAFQGCHSGDNRYVQGPGDLIARFTPISPDKTCGQWEKPGSGNCTKAAMRKTVAACLTSVDDAIGGVVAAFQRAEMWADTLLTLSTDNGGPTDNTDNNNMNNYPLRGCKGGYFEGGMRGVGVLHGAGVRDPGRVSRALHHVTDWLPTLLTAAKRGAGGGAAAAHGPVRARAGELPFLDGDGVDNWDALAHGAPSGRSEIIHVVQAPGSVLDSHALRSGDWKLLWHPAGTDCSRSHPGWYPPPGKKDGYAKFTVQCPPPPASPSDAGDCTSAEPCLFNVSADPCEHRNVAAQNPDVVAALTARISDFRRTAVLPWLNFKNSDPRYNPEDHGPDKDGYQGVIGPWLAKGEDAQYYPTNYSGPGYTPDTGGACDYFAQSWLPGDGDGVVGRPESATAEGCCALCRQTPLCLAAVWWGSGTDGGNPPQCILHSARAPVKAWTGNGTRTVVRMPW